jgi:hypothetical protein
MDKKIRKRAFDYVLSDIRNDLTVMKKSAEERCEKGHQPGAVYRLAAIDIVLKYLEDISSSPQPWKCFDHEATYDTRRITKKIIFLLIKHNVIEGTDSVKDIQFLNSLSKSWGLVDLIVAQMRNRLTRKKCMQLFKSHATCRWERAAETYMANQSSKGKIRRCLVYLYSSKLLPGHDQREVQSFIRLLEKYDNINWNVAPNSILATKHRLEQINASVRQRRKKEREENQSDEN